MSPRATAKCLSDFAITLGALAFLAGILWLGVNIEWTRPWLIGWLMASIIVTPPLLVLFSANGRDDENEGRE